MFSQLPIEVAGGGHGPQVSCAPRSLRPLAKMGADRQVVAHRVLPSVVVGLEEWISLTEMEWFYLFCCLSLSY